MASPLTVSIPPELDGYLRDQVSAGAYATTNEMVREGLLLLKQRDQAAADVGALRVRLQRASAQADRGELVDGNAVFTKLDQIIDRHEASADRK